MTTTETPQQQQKSFRTAKSGNSTPTKESAKTRTRQKTSRKSLTSKSCYQAVVCFTQKLFYNVCDSMENDNTFTLVCRYRKMEDFLKSNRKGVLCVKNARLCHAWNKGETND